MDQAISGTPLTHGVRRRDNVENEIQLAEYHEAVTQCRWYEQLTRTALAIFSALATGVLAYLSREGSSPGGNALVSGFGLLVSCVMLGSHLRTNFYYRSYMLRLHELEQELGMRLYLGALAANKTMRIPSNKVSFSFIYGAAVFAFLAIAVVSIRDLIAV